MPKALPASGRRPNLHSMCDADNEMVEAHQAGLGDGAGVLGDDVVELLVLLRVRGHASFYSLPEVVVGQLEPVAEDLEVVEDLLLVVDLDLALIHQLIPRIFDKLLLFLRHLGPGPFGW